jgi:hypothetical protein
MGNFVLKIFSNLDQHLNSVSLYLLYYAKYVVRESLDVVPANGAVV